MKLSLVVMQGKPEGKEIPIRLPQFLIGRDPECQLRPASPLVSKRHCAFLFRDGKAYLRDFNSTNGTLVNSKPLQGETELEHGMVVKIGPLTFKVKLEAVEELADTVVETGSGGGLTAGRMDTPGKGTPVRNDRPKGEDAIAEMLFNFGDDSGSSSASDSKIPTGTTIMSVLSNQDAGDEPTVEDQPPEEGRREEKKEKKAIPDSGATSNAAKAILDKYMRRPADLAASPA